MSVWDWYDEYKAALLSSDGCTELHHEMIDLFDSRIDDQLDIELERMKRARGIAEQLREDGFVLWCDVWISMTLGKQNRLLEAKELLLKSAVRARDPKYNGTPQQIMINVLFISRLGDMDSAGNLDQILQGQEFIESICDPYSEHLFVLYSVISNSFLDIGDTETALEYIHKQADLLPHHPGRDYLVGIRRRLMFYHFLRHEWNELISYADEALTIPNLTGLQYGGLLCARACALLHLESGEAGQRDFEKSRLLMKEDPNDRFYRLGSYFLEHSNQLEKAIDLRLDQQERGNGMGRYWELACGAKHLIHLFQKADDAVAAEQWREKLEVLSQDLLKPLALDAICFD